MLRFVRDLVYPALPSSRLVPPIIGLPVEAIRLGAV